MTIGAMRQRIVFQARGVSVDSFGQQVTTWTDAFGIWASIEPVSARELFAAQAVQSEVSHRITVRYRAEFANQAGVAAMRAVSEVRIFNIHGAVDTDGRRRWVELRVTEGLNNG